MEERESHTALHSLHFKMDFYIFSTAGGENKFIYFIPFIHLCIYY